MGGYDKEGGKKGYYSGKKEGYSGKWSSYGNSYDTSSKTNMVSLGDISSITNTNTSVIDNNPPIDRGKSIYGKSIYGKYYGGGKDDNIGGGSKSSIFHQDNGGSKTNNISTYHGPGEGGGKYNNIPPGGNNKNSSYYGNVTNSSNYGIRGGGKRRAFDLTSNVLSYLEDWNLSTVNEYYQPNNIYSYKLQSHKSFARDNQPTHLINGKDMYGSMSSVCCRNLLTAYNKSKTPINSCSFNPTGRRLCVGNQNGELSLWNTAGGCQFEIVQQSHTSTVRVVHFAQHGELDEVLFTGDQVGVLKIWDKCFYNSYRFQPHDSIPIRDLATSPNCGKLVTCADEPTVKVFDFRTFKLERKLEGHGYDVRCLDWHPSLALIATGSKDNQTKLYDPRVSDPILTLYHHKNSVARMKFQPNGMSLASGGKDQLIHILDIRTMKLKKSLKGHPREITSLSWHPKFENILCSGGFDPCLYYWDLHNETSVKDDVSIIYPSHIVKSAHDTGTMTLTFHPMGHVLVTTGRDGHVRFWGRLRPGESVDPNVAYIRQQEKTAEKISERISSIESNTFIIPDAPISSGLQLDSDLVQIPENVKIRLQKKSLETSTLGKVVESKAAAISSTTTSINTSINGLAGTTLLSTTTGGAAGTLLSTTLPKAKSVSSIQAAVSKASGVDLTNVELTNVDSNVDLASTSTPVINPDPVVSSPPQVVSSPTVYYPQNTTWLLSNVGNNTNVNLMKSMGVFASSYERRFEEMRKKEKGNERDDPFDTTGNEMSFIDRIKLNNASGTKLNTFSGTFMSELLNNFDELKSTFKGGKRQKIR